MRFKNIGCAGIVAAGLVLSGCGSIPVVGQFYKPGPDKTALVIKQYCQRTSSGLRDSFRAQVNEHSQPHEVYVWCYGEAPPWLDSNRLAGWLETPEGQKWLNETLDEATQ